MTSIPLLDTVELETGSPAEASVVWLHGLGADGHDFEPIVPELGLAGRRVRFVFPHAPVRPVTLNGGIPMRAWFDVSGLDRRAPQDEAGIRDATERVHALIRRENERGVASRRIVLAGFSQGGAVALRAGLTHREPLAGILALSAFLPLAGGLAAEATPENRATPILLAHGTLDPLVAVQAGEAARDWLIEHGYAVEWHTYPMGHAVCAEEVADLRGWLHRIYTAR
jgi:phospholipase/carboxylesterase